ncbi:MAG: hypothetical protein PHE17_18160 [Thiothrix sp.]|uniref:hypothetical protein n=1 Tax=Thiothrix sp. TaxID=1032 RepID=UPI00262E10B4|nr:hypothetical protein [Thiothrix sp.]MDD5394946.1 hypothetical protein [Thiothrix sp.]
MSDHYKGPERRTAEHRSERSRHFLFNPEWWTWPRKIYGIILGVGFIAVSYLSVIQARDSYEQRVTYPYHLKCFEKMNDSVNGPLFKSQRIINRSMMFTAMRIEKRQQQTLTKGMVDAADAAFRNDSLKIEAMLKMGGQP